MRIRFAVAIAAALAWGLWDATAPLDNPGPALFDAAISLPSDPREKGGFSGLELTSDGQGYLMISDRGRMQSGRLLRQNGHLTGVTTDQFNPLLDINGKPVKGKRNDAEGLARSPNGTILVSFEGADRILSYAPGQTRPTTLPADPAFGKLQGNRGLEALAIDATGTVFTIPEAFWQRRNGTPVFRLDASGWTRVSGYRRTRGFQAVGADFGPDGRLYILERRFPGPGFSSRVRSYAVTSDRLHDERLVLITPFLLHANLEGLSVWTDKDGNIRLTMVSDDNFTSFLRSEIVEYILPKHLANKAEDD